MSIIYKNLLNNLDIKTLKKLISVYMKHVKITISKKTKNELIEHILKHTELKDNKIISKNIEFIGPYKDINQNKTDIKKYVDSLFDRNAYFEGGVLSSRSVPFVSNYWNSFTNPIYRDELIKRIKDIKSYKRMRDILDEFISNSSFVPLLKINKTQKKNIIKYLKEIFEEVDKMKPELKKEYSDYIWF
jgi:hypothetical protein